MLRHLDTMEANQLGQALYLSHQASWRAITVAQTPAEVHQILKQLEETLEQATEKMREAREHYEARMEIR